VRLFVAVDVSPETRAELTRVRERLERSIAAARKPPRITCVAAEGAHVTLRFIGDVSDDTGSALVSLLSEPFPLEPFDVRWDALGTFPGGRSPRVVWIGTSRDVVPLATLARFVETRLEPVVGPGESRPFKAHVTVGRVKERGSGFDWPTAIAKVCLRPTMTHVDHVTLYRSRLSPKGPTYTALTTTLLR